MLHFGNLILFSAAIKTMLHHHFCGIFNSKRNDDLQWQFELSANVLVCTNDFACWGYVIKHECHDKMNCDCMCKIANSVRKLKRNVVTQYIASTHIHYGCISLKLRLNSYGNVVCECVFIGCLCQIFVNTKKQQERNRVLVSEIFVFFSPFFIP